MRRNLSLINLRSPTQKRQYEVVTNQVADRVSPSLFNILGVNGDELSNMRRSPRLLRAYFKKRAKLLSPEFVEGDEKRMEELIRAYKILTNSDVKARYLDIHESSIDKNLGILNDGSRMFNSPDPENMSLNELLMSCPDTECSNSSHTKSYQGFDEQKLSGGVRNGGLHDMSHVPLQKPGEVLHPENGAPVQFLLKLAFDEATNGCSKEINFSRDRKCVSCRGSGRSGTRHLGCPQCHGRGSVKLPSGMYLVEEMCDYCHGHGKVPPRLCSSCKGRCSSLSQESFLLQIPPGCANGTVLRVGGKGNDGKRGGKTGELLVSLLVSEHRIFHAVGLDLHCVVPVMLSTALLGGFISVPSLKEKGGTVSLQLPPGVSSGDVFSISGHGITDPHNINDAPTIQRGSLKVHIVVVIPHIDSLSGVQLAALNVFGKSDDGAEVSTSAGRSVNERKNMVRAKWVIEPIDEDIKEHDSQPNNKVDMELFSQIKEANKAWLPTSFK